MSPSRRRWIAAGLLVVAGAGLAVWHKDRLIAEFKREHRGMLRVVAHVMQAAHFLFGAAKPPLSPHELDKVTVTHYAVNTLAERELGYQPVVSYEEGMRQCVEYVRGLGSE